MPSALPQLTRHKPGSVFELAAVSIPLIITALSSTCMMFLDRIILSRYSLEAMNAASAIGTVCAIFQYSGMGVATIAEVFAGQASGAGKYQSMAAPIWQMIWFSLFLAPVFIMVSLVGETLLVSKSFGSEGLLFFRWMMPFSFLMPLTCAVASFYVARGKTGIITLAALISNVLNGVLALILISGINPIIPPMGAGGAAAATIVAQLVQFFILFTAFLGKKNNRRFGTRNARWDRGLFWRCIQIGGPNAIGHLLEISAWAILVRMVSDFHSDYMTVGTIAQSFFILLTFFTDGLQKGIIALASNFLGAGFHDGVRRVLRAAMQLVIPAMIILFVPLVVFPETVSLILVPDLKVSLYPDIALALRGVWFFFLCDGMFWILAGILTSGGDTRFVMVASAMNAWFFVLVPAWVWLHYFPSTPSMVWGFLLPIYGIMNVLCVWWRYKNGYWQKNLVNNFQKEIR